MQALCQWDVQADQSPSALRDFLGDEETSAKILDYAAALVKSYWKDAENIDSLISASSTQWTLSRIAAVDRNVMRVAIVELRGGDVPPKVAINEAIEIVREFGGRESAAFVNGVLDFVHKSDQGEKEDSK
jgi:N utilization substance protein B